MFDLLLPRTCHMCGNVLAGHEKHLCPACISGLPLTRQMNVPANATMKRFDWLPNVEAAAGWIYYHPESPVANILKDIKYHGFSRLAHWLGTQMSREALQVGFLEKVDAIVPVPLHWSRRLRRGYNQSQKIAEGISRQTQIPLMPLLKCRWHRTQTRLSGEQRSRNVKDIYSLRSSFPPKVRRILLIDDVCTTGSTLGSIASMLEKFAPHLKIRILTLATTDR